MSTEAYDKLSRVDFHDGHPIGIAWNGWTLVLDYKNWQEETIRFVFKGVAFISGYGAGASLCHADVTCDSPEMQRIKATLASDWGSSDTWKDKELTQLVILDDVPILTIIFADVEIQRSADPSDTIAARFREFDDSNA